MIWDRKPIVPDLLVGATLIVLAIAAYLVGGLGIWSGPHIAGSTSIQSASKGGDESGPTNDTTQAGDSHDASSVTLSEEQQALVKISPVGYQLFPIEKAAVGSIDFNQDMSVQVFTPYQGRITGLFAKVGDEVKSGERLFTIDSPDLLQAESTLIAAAGTLDLHNKTLSRARELFQTRALAQRELEQAVSEQQAAEGALKAARDAVRIFGKIDMEIDRVIANRQVDSSLLVLSPISGRVTARNAAPGLFMQPGGTPAPFTVADISTMWLTANIVESDIPQIRVGQKISANVSAYPDRSFDGKITTIGAAVDTNTRRLMVRSEIKDPLHALRPGMFATFVIQTADPVRALAVPLSGVVREGDGTMSTWVTKDRRRFERRTVRIGLQHAGYDEIADGLQAGELVATEGALFLSNSFAAAPPE